MKKPVEDWLLMAGKDLQAAEKLLERDDLTNAVAFHCHQSIEKSLKALLLAKDMEIPRIHNLITLWGALKDHVSFYLDINALEMIDETYIDSRYPADIGLLPEGFPSKTKVMDFLKFAQEVFRKVSDESK
jgi:HEPN domain-containing protein